MGFASLGSRFRGGEVADQMTTFVIYTTEYLLYGFASLGSRFRGGEVADQMMTFVIYTTEYLLYGFCVPWEQVPGR
jgi:hypothetical protein